MVDILGYAVSIMSRRRFGGLTHLRFSLVLVAFGLAWVSGCTNPATGGLVAVSGRVTLDGQPVPRGSVSLRPEGGAQNWDQPTGTIAGDGKYAVFTNGQAGAAPGSYRVVIFASEAVKTSTGAAHPGLPRSLIPARYNDPARSPLRIEVKLQSKPGAYDLELTSHDS